MVDKVEDSKPESTPPAIPWRSFLEESPPETIANLTDAVGPYGSEKVRSKTPSILIRCNETECNGMMWFDHEEGAAYAPIGKWEPAVLIYRCRHCKKGFKAYAIYIKPTSTSNAIAVKIGEYPSFGSYTPARVISLIDPDRDLFLKGRRAENRGLGIGAFAYYRRVVENQKNRIIGEIAKVARKVGARQEVIEALELAAKETQFSTAVDSIKSLMPESLLIDGHNPLKLLHSALSKGIHEQDDSKCLDLAESIRVVLTDLSERIELALRDQAELKSAVSKIMQENAKK
jgi:hypothetical protein